MQRIAVIGAGMSGLACASRISATGAKIEIFDKGRRLGGRLATRIQDGFAFNHGAPSFTAIGQEFTRLMAELLEADSAAKTSMPANEFVGAPHMNDLLGPLTASHDVYQSVEICALEIKQRSWHLKSVTGSSLGPFDAVALCIPAPQARQLIQPFNPEWAVNLDTVCYTPCLTMMVALNDCKQNLKSKIFESHNVIAKQIRQSTMNALSSDQTIRLVVHATPEWSKQNINREPQEIARDLLKEFLSLNALDQQRPAFLQAHRWRYAQVKKPLGLTCLWDSKAQFGLAGDWCLGPNVEHAYESGITLANKISSSLLINK